MNVKKMISALTAKGYNVGVYHRPDGGVRITSINGVKYGSSGGAGNNAARKILGVSLTAKQKAQRSIAGKASAKGHKLSVYVQEGEAGGLTRGKHKAVSITKKEKAFLRKYNAAVRKLNVQTYEYKGQRQSGSAQRVETPRISTEYFRKGKTRFGSREEIRKLKNNLRKGLGFANVQHVEGVIEKLKMSKNSAGNYRYPKAIDFLEQHKNQIDDSAMIRVLEMTYDQKNGQKVSDEELDEIMLKVLKEGTKTLKESAKLLKEYLK